MRPCSLPQRWLARRGNSRRLRRFADVIENLPHGAGIVDEGDQTTVNNISEDRLKHYNKILKEQLAELEQEILHVESGFMAQFGINPFERVPPGTIMRDLATEIVGVQHTIRDLKKDVTAFEDIKKVKAWLKKVQREAAKMDDYGDCPF